MHTSRKATVLRIDEKTLPKNKKNAKTLKKNVTEIKKKFVNVE